MIQISNLQFEEVKLLSLDPKMDHRGYFVEMYRAPLYKELGISMDFVQDNCSFSKKNTIRGMHFQTMPGQDKLISVIEGTIYDVFVDVRPQSNTFGRWGFCELAAEKKQQLFIPKGFAHGFAVLTDCAYVVYKVSSVFNPETEKSFCYNDPDVAIDWPFLDPLLSEKDRAAPRLKELFV